MTDNKRSQLSRDSSETDFLSHFQAYIQLEKDLEITKSELEALKGKTFVGERRKRLYQKLQIISEILNEEIPSKAAESLQALDSPGLYRILADTLLILGDRLTDEAATEEHYQDVSDKISLQRKSVHSDSEIRAVSFLYLLVRFVESKRRFPRQKEMKELFDGYFDQIESLDYILSQSEKMSPSCRLAKKLQRRHELRNSVGVGSDKEDAKHQSESSSK